MLELFGTLLLCTAMVQILRGGLASDNGFTIVGMDAQNVSMGAAAFLLAVVYFGPMYGLAIVLAVMIHEFGHVAAYRIAGHDDARFRLIPMFGGIAISDKRPDSQLHDFFITLMGPGICIAPMVAAMVAQQVLAPIWSEGADFLWCFAIVTGTINFFNLLPIWPLDGGRCLRIIVDSLTPNLTRFTAIAVSAGFAAAAVSLHSLILFAFALISAQTFFSVEKDESSALPSLPRSQGFLALFAYLFTMAAHFWGGYILLDWLI